MYSFTILLTLMWMFVSAGPSWQTCTTSARPTELVIGEQKRLKTCRTWCRTASPTCRYQHLLHGQLASTLTHTDNIVFQLFLAQMRALLLSYLRLICSIHNCQCHFPPKAGGGNDSSLFQVSDLTTWVFVILSRLLSNTETAGNWQICRHAYAEM